MTASPPRIRPLDEHLINQIAAGEVIERPAAAVKELIENSVDAGATRIDVELLSGGIERIVVSDNGCGIRADELGAALTRHWTSKLHDADGLAAITSLGFRGEALASICAVADLEIVTRTRDDAHAWRISVSAGASPGAPQPARGNIGCRVEVRGLFHRIPARRRFLKQPRTELLHVQRLLRQFGFAQPTIAFNLSQPGARALRLRPAAYTAMAPRWQTLFGAAFCNAAQALALSHGGIAVSGWVGGPELASSQSELQYVALNGRIIRDRHLQHAVRAAYGESVAAGTFPAYALALALDPGAVDVNVHPGKLEVRFADLRAVHDVLLLAVRRALDAGDSAAASASAPAPAAPAPAAPALAEPRRAWHAAPAPRAGAGVAPALRALPGRPLALVDGRFVLCDAGTAVYALDLRAGWEAVLARRLGTGGARPLLLPLRLPRDAGARLAGDEELAALGFVCDELGPAGAVLRAVPQVLPALDYARLMELLAEPAAGAVDRRAAVAAAAARALELGSGGQPARRLLEELERGAGAAGVDLRSHAVRVSAAMLAAARDE